MTKKQENKLRMLQSVKGVLDENKEVYQPYDIVVEGVTKFNTLLSEIIRMSTQTGTDTTGVTEAKTAAKDATASMANELIGSMKAMAFDSNDAQLEAAVNFSYSKIRYANNVKALQMANVILEQLNRHQNDLGKYMISAEDVAKFQAAVNEFQRLSESKGEVKSSRVTGTKQLSQLFRETDALLNKSLDQLILRLKSKHPAFYDTYTNARNILDY